MVTLKDIKKDDLLTLKEIKEPKGKQVWVKSHYDKTTKRYVVFNWADIGKSKLIKGSKEIFIDFIF